MTGRQLEHATLRLVRASASWHRVTRLVVSSAFDVSQHMLALAEQRCTGLPQVTPKPSKVEHLTEEDDATDDAVVCVQTLLCAPDVTALIELLRVLK